MSLPQQRMQQWQNILQMTEQLQQLSAEENWEALTELESQRMTRLKDFFSTPVLEVEAAVIAEGIQDILKSDQLLLQAGQNSQQALANSVQKISTGRQAIKAYSHFQK